MAIDWQAVVALTGILFFVAGGLFGAIKWLVTENVTQLKERFNSFDSSLRDVEKSHEKALRDLDEKFEMKMEVLEGKMDQREARLDRVKDELKDFKLEVAQGYVPHDDWVRVEGGQNIMLQRISDQIGELAVTVGAEKAASSSGSGAGGAAPQFPDTAQP